jgi:hypothetical protein
VDVAVTVGDRTRVATANEEVLGEGTPLSPSFPPVQPSSFQAHQRSRVYATTRPPSKSTFAASRGT